ncbi:MAG TPA: alpha-2-macroglobulin, partial [Mizugakiibacter sp.]
MLPHPLRTPRSFPFPRLASLAALALALAACGGKPAATPPLQGKAVVPKASAPARPQPFALLSARPDVQAAQPTLQLEFSRRLAGAQAFDSLIAVNGPKGETVGGSWVLDEEGRILSFPYVQADATYSVRIRGALMAADGATLGRDVQQDVYTGPLEPAAGFASQGNVLPARGTRGLPVISVNVGEVDVEFLRVRDDALPAFFASYQRNARRSGWDLDSEGIWWGHKGEPLTRIAASVYSNRFALDGKPNERTISYLPIQNVRELAQPGLYFAVMKRAGTFRNSYETCYFFVSDIGLHTRVYRQATFVHAASLKSGEPRDDIELAVLDGAGRSLLEARTDRDGNALLAWTPKPDQVLVARSGRDVSMLPFNRPALDVSNFDVAGRKQAPFEVFAWSGRDLYRPGETLRVAALLRDFDGRPLKPQPLFLRLKQPDGRTFAEATLQPHELGYFEWTRAMPADAPTGSWQVEFRTDPAGKEAVQSFAFHLEEFLPERLKLDLGSAQPRLKPGEPLHLAVDAAYLYGAPAAGNRFTAKLLVSAEQHPIDALKDYAFGDPTLDLPKDAQDMIDTKLDEHGALRQNIALPAEAKPVAPVAAIVSGSVYESGGRAVTRTLKRVLWPADVLVGVRPLFDPKDGADSNSRAGFEIVRADAAGTLLAGKDLRVRLIRERRDYHWRYDRDGGWHVDYAARFENVEERSLDLAAGRNARLDFAVEWGNYRLEIDDPATGLTMRYPFFAGWRWDDSDNLGKEARPDKVKLKLDKPRYRAGDTLKVTVTPPHPGPGVLLVESDRLLYTRDIDARAGATFEIPVTRDWERHDVYVTALVFRGGSATERITPARAVGIAHVDIDRGDRRVAVKLEAVELMRPDRSLAVQVKAPALAGQKAYVTLSAVDLGVLNITRYAVPDAAAWFFGKRALGVDAFDLYGRIIESFDGVAARLRYGGDMAPPALPHATRPNARVQIVDLFAGPVALDAQGNATVRVDVPDFNGTLRLAALVYGERKYGAAEAQTVVRAPLVAEPSTPRVMAPGDRAAMTLDLRNLSGKDGTAKVRVRSEGPLAIDGAVRSVALADGAKQTVAFALRAKAGSGVGAIDIHAELGDYAVDRHFELIVRPAWPETVASAAYALDKPQPLAFDAEAAKGLMPATVRARLTLSALPPLPYASALAGVLRYPYGCIEQTTSKAYATLLLDDGLARMLGVPPLGDAERQARVAGAFARISGMQTATGHFSMWGGDGYVNPFLTPYVVEFLLDARDAGFAVPRDTLQKALQRLGDDLLAGGHPYYSYEHADHLRFADEAYSGYVLARVNRAPLGTLRALYDNDRGKALTPLPLVHLGVALKLMGDAPRAEKAVAQAFAMQGERPWYLGDYGSELRDTALMVALVHRYGLDKPEYDARVLALARDVIERQHQNDVMTARYPWWGGWSHLSTQEQVALARLARTLVGTAPAPVRGSLVMAGQREHVEVATMWSRDFDGAELDRGVHFEPVATPLFATFDVAGVPLQAPAADGSKIDVRRRWYTTDGKPWDGDTLKEGDTLIVGLAIEAREDMPDALVTELLPGGLELENLNLTDASQWEKVVVDGINLSERGSAADLVHEEFRDDRYAAALHLSRGQQAHLFYLVRAVTPGNYAVP